VSTRQRNTGKGQSKKQGPSAKRRVVVLVSLVGVLTLTSALLLAIAPAPLSTQTAASLLAVDDARSIDDIFDLPTSQMATWNYIYIHQSATAGGSADTLKGSDATLADHFVIGNGEGAGDGEIQVGVRWKQQLQAGRIPGAAYIDRTCLSICLVGDFSDDAPKATQERQLVQLVTALQNRLHIPASRVSFFTNSNTVAGVGAAFPAKDFRKQILP
jgi:N-acetylmuramoyl-L-alanine amidase-like protein